MDLREGEKGLSDQDRLMALLLANHPAISVWTYEEADALGVVRGAAVEMGRPLWQWSIDRGVVDGLIGDGAAVADSEHPAAAMYWLAQQTRSGLAVMLDVAGHLEDERTLRMLRELITKYQRMGSTVVLVDHLAELPGVVKAYTTPFELSLPEGEEIEAIIKSTLRQCNDVRRLRVDLSRKELDWMLQALRGLNRRQISQIVRDAVSEDQCLDAKDLASILSHKRRAVQGEGILEYVESPVNLEEIGGLRKLKGWLGQRQGVQGTEAAAFGLPAPRGVLMRGVQGAGKSLAAKAVATAWRWPLLRMDAGALYDRYIGESERRLRESLRQAERMAPVVLWIDEIEKAFAGAASQSVDGGLSRRMFGTMLTWMQEHRAAVFLIATANDIEALPPELLRKGRFDEIFFVDLPDQAAREQILGIHLKKRGRNPEKFDIRGVAAAMEGFSGAEIEQAVVSALYRAFAEKREVSGEGIVEAARGSPPLSVTMRERVEALRGWARGRCVEAD